MNKHTKHQFKLPLDQIKTQTIPDVKSSGRQPKSVESTQRDLVIVKEILTHAYSEYQMEQRKNPQAKLDQVRLIQSYEKVLRQYGIDPVTDDHYYKLLMEMEAQKPELLTVMEEHDNKRLALEHYLRCLQAKSFFAFVQNMVNHQVAGEEDESVLIENQFMPQIISITQKSGTKSKKKSGKSKKISKAIDNKENKVQATVSQGNSRRTSKGKKPLNEVEQHRNLQQTQEEYFKMNDQKEVMTRCNSNQMKRQSTKSTLNNASNATRIYSPDLIGVLSARSMQHNQTLNSQREVIIIPSPSEGQLNQSNSQEDASQFKLLLKYLRLWKRYVGKQRDQKVEEQRFLQKWAVSIHFHEQTLLSKTLVGLRKSAEMFQKQENQSHQMLLQRQMKKLQICFQQWKSKHQNLKALSHWGHKTQASVLQRFKHYLIQQKHLRLTTLDKYLEQPLTLKILLSIKFGNQNISHLDQLLFNSTSAQYHEFIPYILMASKKYTLLQSFNAFRNLTRITQHQRFLCHQFKLRTVFGRLVRVTRKQSYLQRKLTSYQNIKAQKNLWNHFAKWLQLTSLKLVLNQRQSQAKESYNKLLKHKAIQGLLINLSMSQHKQSYLRKSQRVKLTKRMEAVFKAWKFHAVFNRKFRSLSTKAKLVHHKGTLSHYFMIWIKSAIASCNARLYYEKSLKTKVFSCLLKNIENKEATQQMVRGGEAVYQIKTMRLIYTKWQRFTQKQQVERNLKRTVFKYMKQNNQRRLLTGWRNQITQMKFQKYQRDNARQFNQSTTKQKTLINLYMVTKFQRDIRHKAHHLEEITIERSKQRHLLGWLQLFTKKLLIQRNFKQFSMMHMRNLLQHYFNGWCMERRNRQNQKHNFYRGRAFNLIKIAYQRLREYTQNKLAFRQRLNRYLRMRARNLQVKALSHIYKFTKQNEVKRKYKKVAGFVFLEKTLKKHLNAIKSYTQQKQKAKLLKNKVDQRLVKGMLQRWKVKYLKRDIALRFNLRSRVEKQFKSFNRWKTYSKLKKQRQTKINLGLLNYSRRLYSNGLRGMIMNVSKKQLKRVEYGKAYSIYLFKLMREVYLKWAIYQTINKHKQQLLTSIITKKNLTKLVAIFTHLRNYSAQKSQLKKILNPHLKLKRRRIQRTSLVALYRYSFKRSILKANYDRYITSTQYNIKSHIFDVLSKFVAKNSYKKVISQKANIFSNHNMVRKSLFGFEKNRIMSTFAKTVIKQGQLNTQHKIMQRWISAYNETQLEKPILEAADLYRRKKDFVRFIERMAYFVARRSVSFGKRNSAIQMNRFNIQQRAFKRLHQVTQTSKITRMKKKLADLLFSRKAFYRWKLNQAKLTKGKTQFKIIVNFREYQLLKRGMNNLRLSCQSSRQQFEKGIVLMQARKQFLIEQCWKGLLVNKGQNQRLKEKLRKSLKTISQAELRPFFQRWVGELNFQRKQEQAIIFTEKRGVQNLIKKCFSSLKHYYLCKRSTHELIQSLSYQRNQKLKHEYLTTIIYRYQQNIKTRQNLEEFTNKKVFMQKAKVMLELFKYTQISKRKSQGCLKANIMRKSLVFKKVIFSLQKNLCMKQAQQLISTQSLIRQSKRVLNKWKLSYLQSQYLGNLTTILDRTHQQSKLNQFFQRLVRLSFYQQIFETMEAKRLRNYAMTFISLIKREQLYSQIVHGFRFARDVELKRRVFEGFAMHREKTQLRISMIESQVNIALDQANSEQIRQNFDRLRAYAQSKKLKRYTQQVYIHRLLRKGLLGIQMQALRTQAFAFSSTQIRINIAARYFRQWQGRYQESIQNKLQVEAQNVMLVKNIFDYLKDFTQKQKAAKFFYVIKLKERLQPICFQALQGFGKRQEYLRYCQQEIANNWNYQRVKDVMLHWMEYHNLRRISENMKKFHQYKVIKNVIDEWKILSEEGSYARRQVIEMRHQIFERPHLAKPILAIRNVTCYKAFQLLKLGTKISNQSIEYRNNSSYALYTKLTKKAFFSLKMNASKQSQNRKLKELRNFFIMRRWFQSFKGIIQELKEERQKRTNAIVFGMLNLQRKAFEQLLEYASQRQQQRIKTQFADELYFKRLADKVIMGLRISIQRDGDLQSKSNYLMNSRLQESKLHDTTVLSNPLGKSRYEQELSVMQIECSQVFDLKEKKKLVPELYHKKTLYKCFVSWANLALCLSEDEEECQMESDNDNDLTQAD